VIAMQTTDRIRELIFYLPALFLIIIPFLVRMIRQARKKKRDQASAPPPTEFVSQTPPEARELPKIMQINNSTASIFPSRTDRHTQAQESNVPPMTVAKESPGLYEETETSLPQKTGRRLDSLPPLKRAIVWAEILGPSKGITSLEGQSVPLV
jgi:hypothetical protein